MLHAPDYCPICGEDTPLTDVGLCVPCAALFAGEEAEA